MKQVIIGCFLSIIIFFNAFSRDIYVSPKGNNQFPGTREKPIQSILLAKQMAYQYLQSSQD